MEIQYFGANCVRLTTKKAQIVVDDNLQELGLKSATKAGDIVLSTHNIASVKDEKLVIAQPGEYEVSSISIQGIAARAHMDNEGQETATIFKLVAGETNVAILGHIYPELSDDQLEAIGMVDVLIVPVGGNGYTLDPVGALKLIKKIEPKVIIPTHFADKAINYPVPQQELAEAIKGLSMEPSETVAKLKISADGTESTKLIVLERQ